MIAVDTNILVYAHRQDSGFHDRASSSLRALAESPSSWAIPWSCLHEFIAVVTHPRIYDPPSTIAQALAQIEAWLDSPTLTLIGENSTYWETLRRLLDEGEVIGARVHDARVAAVAMCNGVRELWSADRDFSRFPVASVNPLLD